MPVYEFNFQYFCTYGHIKLTLKILAFLDRCKDFGEYGFVFNFLSDLFIFFSYGCGKVSIFFNLMLFFGATIVGCNSSLLRKFLPFL